jgi:hypothetical protein
LDATAVSSSTNSTLIGARRAATGEWFRQTARLRALAAITGRELFDHSSGLAVSAQDGRRHVMTRPGSAWKYSGMGYLILQHAVQRLWGESLDGLVASTVTVPLGMVETSYLVRPLFPKEISLTDFGSLLACGRLLLDETVPGSFKCRFDTALGLLAL